MALTPSLTRNRAIRHPTPRPVGLSHLQAITSVRPHNRVHLFWRILWASNCQHHWGRWLGIRVGSVAWCPSEGSDEATVSSRGRTRQPHVAFEPVASPSQTPAQTLVVGRLLLNLEKPYSQVSSN